MNQLAKMLILFGTILIVTGLIFQFAQKIPGLGRLPGDVYIRKGSFSFYFPLATSLIISVILTLILNLFGRK